MSIDIATNSTKCFTFSNCVDKEATRMKTDNAPMQSTARPLYRSRSTHFNSIYLYSKAAIDAARAAHYSPYTGDLLKKIDQQQGVNVVCRDEEIVTPPIEVVSSPVADVDVSLTIDLESPGSDNDFSIEGLLEDYNDCQTSVNTIEASDKSTSGTAEARDISPPVNSGVATITENDNCHYSNALLRKDIIVGDEKYVKNTTIPFDCRCTPEEAAEVTTCSRVNPLLGLFFKSDEMHSITFFRSVYIMLHIHGLDFRFRHSYYDIDNPPKTLNEFSNLFFSYEQDAIVTIFKGLENNEENKTISYVKHVFQFEFDLLEKCDVSEGAYCDRVNGMPGAEYDLPTVGKTILENKLIQEFIKKRVTFLKKVYKNLTPQDVKTYKNTHSYIDFPKIVYSNELLYERAGFFVREIEDFGRRKNDPKTTGNTIGDSDGNNDPKSTGKTVGDSDSSNNDPKTTGNTVGDSDSSNNDSKTIGNTVGDSGSGDIQGTGDVGCINQANSDDDEANNGLEKNSSYGKISNHQRSKLGKWARHETQTFLRQADGTVDKSKKRGVANLNLKTFTFLWKQMDKKQLLPNSQNVTFL
ncbi:unnamed protein product [Ambrosiozyma monospora]|uniref:Unnamed protein product n=1 Tax=Ambrosiozyma monospora TaxID=43982 RepID=A0A9W6T3F7_AMBMO|nr:unnamed protein product [Ambrosiozyma monospora]